MEKFIHSLYGFSSIHDTMEYFHSLFEAGSGTIKQMVVTSFIGVILEGILQMRVSMDTSRLLRIALILFCLFLLYIYCDAITRQVPHANSQRRFSLQISFFIIAMLLHCSLLILLFVIVAKNLQKTSMLSGTLIGFYLVASIFGANAIFKSFKLSAYIEFCCMAMLVVLSIRNKPLLEVLPIFFILSLFLLYTMRQIDNNSVQTYKVGKQLHIEHKKITLCFENSNNAIAILSIENYKLQIDYFNNVWTQEPLNAKEGSDIIKLLALHRVKEVGTISDVIKNLSKQSESTQNVIKQSYYIDVLGSSCNFHFKIDISLIGNISGNQMIFLQYNNNTSSIELAQMKIKENMISSITHELLTPLNPILAIAEKTNATEIDERALYVLNINSTLLHLKIRDFICYSEYIAGTLFIKEVFNDIKAIILKAISLFSEEAKTKNIFITNQISKMFIAPILFDGIRILQLLCNLLSNAIKYTSNGHILVSAILVANKQVEISVEDTGQGFDIEKYNTGQIDGIGFTIMKFICDKMGTKLYAQSLPQKGSKLWFRIKYKSTASFVPEEYDPNDNYNFYHIRTFSSFDCGFLIADDINFNRVTLKLLLNKIAPKVSIFEAANGQEAIFIVQNKHKTFNKIVVFMDVDMPIMDGVTATKNITLWSKKNGFGSKISIVGVTAFNTNEIFQKCRDAGMVDVYTKPISLAQLNRCISNLNLKHMFSP